MPALGNPLDSPALALHELTSCSNGLKPVSCEDPSSPNFNPDLVQELDPNEFKSGPDSLRFNDDRKGEIGKCTEVGSCLGKGFGSEHRRGRRLGDGIERDLKRCRVKASTEAQAQLVEEWSNRRTEQGVPECKSFLPFLVGAPKSVQCGVCQNAVYREEEVLCSVHGCHGVFHLTCAKEWLGFSSSKQFKCPQHVCFLCKQKNHLWRCIKCPIAFHDKCAAFPEHVVHLPDRPREAICWKHPTDWHLEKHEVPANTIEDVFSLLPLPHMEEEFNIDMKWKNQVETKLVPQSYAHIKRNVYLIKRKRNNVEADVGCTNCSSKQCSEGCVCKVQCVSCSKACHCPKDCKNRPFQRMKKIQIVKTELCGWGVVAAESISKGDFIVEYVGEVINDAMCERRLWDMKDQDAKNFYMCEINKDFVIDATFKGNASRFLNHSCAPNCKLEKWQVEGETRVGIFASRSIEVGEPLTYDYRFVQFGPEVKCHCGAPNCSGYLGTKRRIIFPPTTKRKLGLELSWGGPRRQRTSTKMIGLSIG